MDAIFEHPESQHAQTRGKAKVEAARRRGDVHLRFCVRLAQAQMQGDRYFVYEHPRSAASRINSSVDRLASTPGVMRTELDQCEFGLMSEDEIGRAPAKQLPLLLTSSVEVNRMMSVKCREGIDMYISWQDEPGRQRTTPPSSAGHCARA